MKGKITILRYSHHVLHLLQMLKATQEMIIVLLPKIQSGLNSLICRAEFIMS